METDVEVVCVTSNPTKSAEAFLEAKRRWLRRFIPELAESLVAAKIKTGLGLDILVDDAPQHHESPDCVPILVERPWNSRVVTNLKFSDWADGEKIIFKLIEGMRHGKY